VADGVDADDPAVFGQLDRSGEDGHVDGVAAYLRPAAYGVPAKLTTSAASASRVTVTPAVASRARRAAGTRVSRSAWSSRIRWA
jgi:hypothetical protein